MLRIVAPLGLDLYHYALDGANWISLANLASRIVLELISERGILEVTNTSCTRGTNRNISYVNRQETALTWHTCHPRVSYIPVSFSHLYYRVMYPLSQFPFRFLPILFSFHTSFSFFPVCCSRIQTASTSERFSEYFPSAAPPASRPRQMQRTRGRRLCAIVVSRLLFLGNFTSFTNYPLRAHAIRK